MSNAFICSRTSPRHPQAQTAVWAVGVWAQVGLARLRPGAALNRMLTEQRTDAKMSKTSNPCFFSFLIDLSHLLSVVARDAAVEALGGTAG